MSWPIRKLGELCQIRRGQSPRPISAHLTEREDGVNWIKIGDATGGGKYITETKQKILRGSAENLVIVQPGDFIMTNSMSFGTPYIVNTTGCVHDGWLIFSDYQEHLNRDYMYHLLKSPDIYSQFLGMIKGSTVSNLKIETVKETMISLPPLDEQKRIAAVLDKADEIKIASNETEKLRANLIRSTFLELFSEVEPNWPIVQLSDVADITCEFVTPTSPEFNELPHIGPDRIKGYTGQILPYKSAREDNVTSGKFHFSNNEILYSKIRPYLRKCAAPDFEGLCSADIYPLTPKEGIVKEYLWYLLLSDEFDRYTQTLPDRSSIPKLNRTELWRFSFPLPPITLQKQFSDVVNSVKNLVDVQVLAQENALSLVQELLA